MLKTIKIPKGSQITGKELAKIKGGNSDSSSNKEAADIIIPDVEIG